jgi:Fe-S-cluster-containing hydrogenase component 2
MIVHYGYTDAMGDFRITVDTDKCDGCGDCLEICPEGIFQLKEDDYDDIKVEVRQELINKVGILCPGGSICKKNNKFNCIETCQKQALSISW